MIPRYRALGTMVQDPNGTYVSAKDGDRRREALANDIREKYAAFQRGELTAEEALAAVFVIARTDN